MLALRVARNGYELQALKPVGGSMRSLLSAFALTLVALIINAGATSSQQPGRVYRIALLWVGEQGVVCHVGSHQARRCLAPLAERTRGVLHRGRRPTRFRVAQQHETEHDADFRAAINLRHVRRPWNSVRSGNPSFRVRRNIAASGHQDRRYEN